MKYLFYEHGELVAELDKCTVVSAADDAGVSTVLLNGKTYQRRKPVEFVQEWVAFDLVNKWAPWPVADSGQTYHVNDGVGEDSPAMNPSVRYFKGQIAERDAKIQRLEIDVERHRRDKIVANGLVANLEGLAAADGEKIRDLESRLETVAASRERSIDDYNKSVAREGRLREELAEVEHQRDGLLATIDSMNLRMAAIEAGDVHADCATEIGRLHCIIKDRDLEIGRLNSEAVSLRRSLAGHYALVGKQRDDAKALADKMLAQAEWFEGLLEEVRGTMKKYDTQGVSDVNKHSGT